MFSAHNVFQKFLLFMIFWNVQFSLDDESVSFVVSAESPTRAETRKKRASPGVWQLPLRLKRTLSQKKLQKKDNITLSEDEDGKVPWCVTFPLHDPVYNYPNGDDDFDDYLFDYDYYVDLPYYYDDYYWWNDTIYEEYEWDETVDAEYVCYDEYCTQLSAGETVVLESPGYPHQNNSDFFCVWSFQGKGCDLQLSCEEDFNIRSCDEEMLSVYGIALREHKTYCGNKKPSEVVQFGKFIDVDYSNIISDIYTDHFYNDYISVSSDKEKKSQKETGSSKKSKCKDKKKCQWNTHGKGKKCHGKMKDQKKCKKQEEKSHKKEKCSGKGKICQNKQQTTDSNKKCHGRGKICKNKQQTAGDNNKCHGRGKKNCKNKQQTAESNKNCHGKGKVCKNKQQTGGSNKKCHGRGKKICKNKEQKTDNNKKCRGKKHNYCKDEWKKPVKNKSCHGKGKGKDCKSLSKNSQIEKGKCTKKDRNGKCLNKNNYNRKKPNCQCKRKKCKLRGNKTIECPCKCQKRLGNKQNNFNINERCKDKKNSKNCKTRYRNAVSDGGTQKQTWNGNKVKKQVKRSVAAQGFRCTVRCA